MTLIHFVRILNRNFNLLVLSALVLAVVVFFLTRYMPSEYKSETEIYTGIASGINLESVEGNSKGDFFTTSNEYDNLINIIKSRQTLEEVGERLLVQHMMLDSADPAYISKENWAHFKFKVPDSLEQALLVPGSIEKTLENIKAYKRDNYNDPQVKLTFYNGNSPYSFQRIREIQTGRIQNSDLIRISYTWTDPGIVKHTLDLLNITFMQKLTDIKMGQSEDVVAYFRREVATASERLAAAEAKLKRFRIDNRVINYNEQTKNIASQKEAMEEAYQTELGKRQAAEAALNKLEEQLALNKKLVEYGGEILKLREGLIDIYAKIAELEVYYNDEETLRKLRKRSEVLKARLSNELLKRYEFSKTTEGVPLASVLDEWLEYSLVLEESDARLEVFRKRKEYFRQTYAEFAPLGSEIAKLEREIGVEERNYLELLHGLNMAILQQTSESISAGGLVITVPPHFPIEALKSKAMLLILVAGMIGFIVPLAFLILMEFLDNTIKTSERAEELTKLKLIGAYPNLTRKSENKNVDFDWLHEKSIGLLAQNLRMEAQVRNLANHKPKVVLVFSTREKDGKLLTTHQLANEMVSLNFKIMVVSYHNLEEKDHPFYDRVTYEANKEFLNFSSLEDIVPTQYNLSAYDYIFFILPSILTHQYPLDIMDKVDLSHMVIGAYRGWNKADKKALEELKRSLSFEPTMLVNGVSPDYMNAVLGDIKKRRSFMRRFMKATLTFQFTSKEPSRPKEL